MKWMHSIKWMHSVNSLRWKALYLSWIMPSMGPGKYSPIEWPMGGTRHLRRRTSDVTGSRIGYFCVQGMKRAESDWRATISNGCPRWCNWKNQCWSQWGTCLIIDGAARGVTTMSLFLCWRSTAEKIVYIYPKENIVNLGVLPILHAKNRWDIENFAFDAWWYKFW
jgi:hypothetical protein